MTYHLTHPLTTPLGEYRAGLEVEVTSRRGDTVTINVSPTPLAARLITVDRRMITHRATEKRTVPSRCGTPSGAQAHRRRHEPVCGKCAVAALNYRRAYEITRGEAKAIPIEIHTLAELYLNADPATQQHVEQLLGENVLTAAVQQHDRLDDAS